MKKCIKRQRRLTAARKARLAHIQETRKSLSAKPLELRTGTTQVVIYRSELDYLSRCILDRPDIETGGQLFGHWTDSGIPVVLYAIGPGPRANHQKTFFNQDVDYLVTVGRELKRRYGLHHIGEWHSHHQLGLAWPSVHDARTMNSTIREKDLGEFILCIGNCDASSAKVKAFLCDGIGCDQIPWDVIRAESPMRPVIDRDLAGILTHPETSAASLGGDRDGSLRPAYAPGYWMQREGSGQILNGILAFLKERNPDKVVRPSLNERGEVRIDIIRSKDKREVITFPVGFPEKCPSFISIYKDLTTTPDYADSIWDNGSGDILSSFKTFYKNL